MEIPTTEIKRISKIVQNMTALELVVLVGSRATTNRATVDSDWDIALQWDRDMTFMDQLTQTEKLRNEFARALNINDNKIDLIDIPTAGLAMREEVANKGIILKGENTLAISHFLTRTWRELEEFYWDKIYAA